ncbi:phytanoyl-CoA dioxygenase family protein [Ohtaekwangia koreensis]|uniref:Ectoine hydroxylase-related dioxygenase, phytanoyl-CoA dioxygenase (PhyH) family n=1 Tax=Ohtaekwangia koreensis TaxID=688867 RepID=A0A1T5MMG7_9BACT|nr:phytanoyl-CoA dioxygenase family protein [Ohtaekwangia koreensis]SKC89069.1 Ectoine hydroxylase-related dioxygenase, phytanoyl-CoA dioxygenase (PhyH) family [Ohtaekwangia koreensis]
MATYKKFTFEGILTEEQINFFQKNGFIHFEKYASQETVDAIIQSTEQVQRRWVKENVQKINGVPIKYGVDENGETIVQRFAFTNQHSEAVNQFANNPALDALRVLMPKGARLGLEEKDGVVFNHYVNSEGSNFYHMGWHTDSARDIFYGKKVAPMLNIGFYLDDSTADKGGLRVLPGTHKQGLWDLLFRKKYYLNNYDDKNEVLVEANAGDLVIHDGRIWHRVAPSPLTGAASRRRVMYIPMIVGKYNPKTEKSTTPLYLHLLPLVGSKKHKNLIPAFRRAA